MLRHRRATEVRAARGGVIARQQREQRSCADRVQDRMMGSWLSSNRAARAARNLVDVGLVAAIVVLVAAPGGPSPAHAHHQAASPALGPAAVAPLGVAVHGDGTVTVEADGRSTTVPLVDLAPTVGPFLAAHPGRGVRVDVADLTPYGIAIETMDTLDSAGCGPIELARR
jgi:biopolymer transport protein ExbD